MRRVSRPLIAVIVVGLSIMASGALWPAGDLPPRSSVGHPKHTVVYMVTGRGSAEITWKQTDENLTVTTSAVLLPWTSRPIIVTRAAFITSLQAGAGLSPVTCTITIDGVPVDTAAGGRTASCAYTFTAP